MTNGRYSGFTLKVGAVIALVLVAAILPIRNAAQAQEKVYRPGELAPITLADSRDPSRLQASVGGGRYALALDNADRRAMVAQNEKLFVLTFSIFNEAGPPREIDEDAVDFLITDNDGRTFDDFIRLRMAGRDEVASTTLMPARTIVLDAVFRVPLNANIIEAYITDAKFGEAPGPRFRFESLRSLPRAVSPDGWRVEASVPAATGVWYPLGGTDVRVNGFEVRSEPLGRFIPDDRMDIITVEFIARNRLNELYDVRQAIYAPTRLIVPGATVTLNEVWLRDHDNSVRWTLEPGDSVALRAIFKVAKGKIPAAIHFVEKMGPRGGLLSRQYEVDFAAVGDDPDAIQADGGRAVRPPPQGVFDPTGLLDLPVVDDTPPASIDPSIIGEERLPPVAGGPRIPPDQLPTSSERSGDGRYGVVSRLGGLTSGSVSRGELMAQSAVIAVAYGASQPVECRVDGFELVLLQNRQDSVSVINRGGALDARAESLRNRAMPGDLVLINNVNTDCVIDGATHSLPGSALVYWVK